jgi:hypothetical protein
MRPGRSFSIVLALFISASFAWAQTNYASLGGVVMDPQHLAIPHAKVTLTAVKTGAERVVVASGLGGCCRGLIWCRRRARGLPWRGDRYS